MCSILSIKVIEGRNLACKKKSFVTIGVLNVDGQKVGKESKTPIGKSSNPEWNGAFSFNINEEFAGIVLRVFEKGKISDSFHGILTLSLANERDEEKTIDRWYNLSKLSPSQSVSGEIHLLMEFKGILNNKKYESEYIDKNNSTSTIHRIVVERNSRNTGRKHITIHNQLSYEHEKEYYQRRLSSSDIYKSRTLSSVLPRTFNILEKTKVENHGKTKINYESSPTSQITSKSTKYPKVKSNKSESKKKKSSNEIKLIKLNTDDEITNFNNTEDQKINTIEESLHSSDQSEIEESSDISEEFLYNNPKSELQNIEAPLESHSQIDSEESCNSDGMQKDDNELRFSKSSTDIRTEVGEQGHMSSDLKKSSSANLLKSLTNHEKNKDNVDDLIIIATRGSLKKLK